MDESHLLTRIYSRSRDLSARFPYILAGPGHDCASIKTPAISLLKVDQLVEHRHFTPDTPLDLIARKAIARAVSDIAASGGTPLAALAAATLPATYPHANELFDRLSHWAIHFNCPLVGGDIASSSQPSPLTLSISILGTPHPSRGHVLRSTALPGDSLYVTGSLGGSLNPDGSGRHLTFDPRLPESRWLCDTLGSKLHAMMDISDGLGRDTARLAAASSARIRINAGSIPMSPGITDWKRAASDGEDYELLFTTPARLPAACPEIGTPITRIGSVESGSGCIIADGSREFDASNMGWDHGSS